MKELIKLIGREGTLDAFPFSFRVTVTDVKCAYGVERLEVSPVAGTGSAWVNADRVKVDA